ncbi:KSR2 Kinase, partial [Chordeiles acutipennis]|nr:KSR2 Kinase [Chordeiles acutipennis]
AGGSLSKQDWTIQWPTTEPGKENSPGCQPEPGQWGRTHLTQSPRVQPKCGQHHCHASSPHGPMYTHVDRLTVEGHPGLCPPVESGHRSLPPSPRQRHVAHTPPRTPNIVTTMTPPGTPPLRRRNKLKPPGTPPPSSRKLIHLIPGFTALHRSKSHEFQLGHRVDEAHTPKLLKASANLAQNTSREEQPQLLWATWDTVSPPSHQRISSSHLISISPLPLSSHHPLFSHSLPLAKVPPQPSWSPFRYWEAARRSPRSLLFSRLNSPNSLSLSSQQSCSSPGIILVASSALAPVAPCPSAVGGPRAGGSSAGGVSGERSRGAESPPSTGLCCWTWLEESSTPSLSPAHPKLSSQPPKGSSSFSCGSMGFCPRYLLWPPFLPPVLLHSPPFAPSQNEEGAEEAQESEDDFEEMNLSLLSARNFPRKASQTSIFLQEWDIPFEQLEIGELIGKGRFGQVFHGRWHGEVAIRLIDIERDNEDQLKAFKRESPATAAAFIIWGCFLMGVYKLWFDSSPFSCSFSLCKGRTLYSVVRDAKIVLDVNKTRQIAQEIVKGMGYLHAKGILHKDLKSKNVFYDNGKVVITDFGLFSISGVLQAGRRENKLRIQNGWLCHLAPEIIRQLSPDTEEDKLPFSKHSDVFALGTIWYELHAREWPFKTQPAEAIIWQVGRGMKPNLSQIGMGKEISDILLFCWAYEQEERPTFTKLMDMLEKLPKRNRRLSHPGHFWKSAE